MASEKELTPEEKEVLNKLREAYNLYMDLPGEKRMGEFTQATHVLQDLVGLRLLKRIHPEIYN